MARELTLTVSDKASKVSADNAMPGSTLSRIELEGLSVVVQGGIGRATTDFFLDVLRNILLKNLLVLNSTSSF
jgi:hypothetical protein